MKTVKSKWTIGEALKQKADENNGSQALVRRGSSVRELTVNAATFAALTAMLVIGMPARAAGNVNVNGNKLQCFSGTTDGDQGGVTYGGTCSLTEAGVATLDNTDGDTDGSYSGVYIQNSNLDGKLLKEVNRLGFSFTGVPTAGSPRLTLPI